MSLPVELKEGAETERCGCKLSYPVPQSDDGMFCSDENAGSEKTEKITLLKGKAVVTLQKKRRWKRMVSIAP